MSNPDWHALGKKWKKKHGDIHTVAIGPQLRVICLDPDCVQQVLFKHASDFHKTELGKALLGPLLGESVLMVDGEEHTRQRRAINPAFQHHRLRAMLPIMLDCATKATDRWLDALQSNHSVEIDASAEMSQLTLDIIGRAAFGSAIGGKTDEAARVFESLRDVLDLGTAQLLSPMTFVPFSSWLPTPGRRKLWRKTRAIKTILLGVIAARRAANAQNPDAEPADLLDLILQTPGMSDERVLDQCVTFVLAGHETTSQALCWTLYLLDKHADEGWWDRLHKEVVGVVGPDGTPGFEQLTREMPTIMTVLNESLRLFPPVPGMARTAARDVTLTRQDGSTFVVPAGCGVAISVVRLHLDERLWEDPEAFKPDRFAAGATKSVRHPMAFIPFSAGRRNCIGQQFALLEARAALARIVQRVRLEMLPTYKHWPNRRVTLRPKYGMPMRVVHVSDSAKS